MEAVKPRGPALTSFTSCISKSHPAPRYSDQPYKWLDAVLKILADDRSGFDVLLCTQEQITVLSGEASKVQGLGVGICVAPFSSLARVYTKTSAYQTLVEAEVLQPKSLVVSSASELLERGEFLLRDTEGDGSIYVKHSVGTASAGVYHCSSLHALSNLASELSRASVFASSTVDPSAGKFLVQTSIKGDLLMIQSIFSHGTLLAWHACLRNKSGPSGGASHKTSLPLPTIPLYVSKIGKLLNWHGALSFDAILADSKSNPPKLYFIDVNPRPVEPMNAWLSGTDFVTPLLELSLGHTVSSLSSHSEPDRSQPVVTSKSNVRTHQFLLSVLSCASTHHPRLSVLRELLLAARHQDAYQYSTEELTPLEGDFFYTFLLFSILIPAILIWPRRVAQFLEKGAVGGYAGGSKGWEIILRREKNRYGT